MKFVHLHFSGLPSIVLKTLVFSDKARLLNSSRVAYGENCLHTAGKTLKFKTSRLDFIMFACKFGFWKGLMKVSCVCRGRERCQKVLLVYSDDVLHALLCYIA